jgi:hypothetical protein
MSKHIYLKYKHKRLYMALELKRRLFGIKNYERGHKDAGFVTPLRLRSNSSSPLGRSQ